MKQRGEEEEKDESLHEKERQREVEKEGSVPMFVGSPKTLRLRVRKLPPA